ncbi:LysR substrate-binding domain-containing protein [Shimia abyssi]|uniref:LysR family hydrogen peroxide-inducible transcriptional activator n=1 Tax=Shimia abyssi TaxID=1662395 RepID=A0A2P8FEJ7_9RHOB|nr:LysR substrate-binding domain-containing protein [Shimia abyssi]PSL20152.1 LysR family hydrogen peroxide-inducible transcriptional activator [Shimia abyssi]
MINVTLRQLRYFDALARQGHFGRAAETCSISQPALSVQIKELEDTLGVQLFERSARKVRLTNVGEDVLTRAREILLSIEELGDLARASQQGLSGRLRLGVIPTIAPYLLPSIMRTLGKNFPALDIHVRETLTSTLLREMDEGRLDAAILALPLDDPTLTEVDLFSEEFVLVRAATDAGKPIPNVDTLHRMRLLLLEEGHCFRDQALEFCNIGGTTPTDGFDGSSLSTLVQMVGSGIGVTLIPEMAVSVETRSAPVIVSHFAAPAPQRRVGMVWRKTNPLADRLEQIAEGVRQSANDLAAQL